jgi:hypothetical protein
MPPLTEAELAARLASAGIILPQAEQDDLRAAYAMLAPALDMIRQPVIPPEAEPALTFAAGER